MEEYNAAPFTSNRPYVPPQTQQDTLKEDIARTVDQLPLIKAVIQRLDERIAATDSVKKALELSVKYEVTKEQALIILDIVNQQLAVERNHIQTKLETVAKHRK